MFLLWQFSLDECLIHNGIFVPEVSVVAMFLSNLCETLMFPPAAVVVGLAVSTVLMLLKKLFWTLIRLPAAIALRLITSKFADIVKFKSLMVFCPRRSRCWHPWS
jgi:hypothetical protein